MWKTPIRVSPGPGSSGQRPGQAHVADRQPDQQRRDADAVAKLGERQAVQRVGDDAVVEEHRPVPGRADREQQVDVLQDAQVAAQRPVVDAIDVAGRERRVEVTHQLDARAIELEAADGGVAAREVALDLGQQRFAPQREALLETEAEAQEEEAPDRHHGQRSDADLQERVVADVERKRAQRRRQRGQRQLREGVDAKAARRAPAGCPCAATRRTRTGCRPWCPAGRC